MRYVALATDYDGTLAAIGRVPPTTIEALERLRKSGRRLLLVTGRELPDLKNAFDRLDLFDRVVAENGALLFRPATNEEVPLTESPPDEFLARLREENVPFSHGHGIVATHEPHEREVLAAIKELGLELHVIFNKGAVMVLPSGVNKATGLHCALEELGLSEHNVIAIGDAENDHAFLSACEFGVAVANAVDTLKERADLVTSGARGAGVEELIGHILEDDLERYDSALQRHSILLGHSTDDHHAIYVPPHRGSVLIAGPSGSGKSTVATALLERLLEHKYQFCLIDPEGDYETLPDAIVLGTATNAPNSVEVLKALKKASQNVVVNLLAIPLSDRPLFCTSLLPSLIESRARTARPHFLIIDEAHHLLPSSWRPAPGLVPQGLGGAILITVHPEWIAPAALESVDLVIVVGKEPAATFASFAEARNIAPPRAVMSDLPAGTAAAWQLSDGRKEEVAIVAVEPSTVDRRRHTRKYAEGELPPDRSFYFRGPEGNLNLRAQNLIIFLQIAEGVDDDTWLYHLRAGEYSRWFREYIKDEELSEEAAQVEQEESANARESRRRIREAIERRYTAAA